jgi:hypothetical protein
MFCLMFLTILRFFYPGTSVPYGMKDIYLIQGTVVRGHFILADLLFGIQFTKSLNYGCFCFLFLKLASTLSRL